VCDSTASGIPLKVPESVVVCPDVDCVIPPYSEAADRRKGVKFLDTKLVVPLFDAFAPD
jgi:hypothetical protein